MDRATRIAIYTASIPVMILVIIVTAGVTRQLTGNVALSLVIASFVGAVVLGATRRLTSETGP